MLRELYEKNRPLFDRYQSLLLKWNEKINLTAITDPREILEKHFLDSLAPISALGVEGPLKNVSRETFSSGSVLDLGAGAGFPGLPLKIVLPALSLTLADSIRKKCDFMKAVARALSLDRIAIRHVKLTPYQSLGAFDFVVSRAAFSLRDLVMLGAASLGPKGILIAYKGSSLEEEVEDSREELTKAGLCPWEMFSYSISNKGVERRCLMITRRG